MLVFAALLHISPGRNAIGAFACRIVKVHAQLYRSVLWKNEAGSWTSPSGGTDISHGYQGSGICHVSLICCIGDVCVGELRRGPLAVWHGQWCLTALQLARGLHWWAALVLPCKRSCKPSHTLRSHNDGLSEFRVTSRNSALNSLGMSGNTVFFPKMAALHR